MSQSSTRKLCMSSEPDLSPVEPFTIPEEATRALNSRSAPNLSTLSGFKGQRLHGTLLNANDEASAETSSPSVKARPASYQSPWQCSFTRTKGLFELLVEEKERQADRRKRRRAKERREAGMRARAEEKNAALRRAKEYFEQRKKRDALEKRIRRIYRGIGYGYDPTAGMTYADLVQNGLVSPVSDD